MAAVAPIEDLKSAHKDLKAIEKKHPEAFTSFVDLFKAHRKIGYKNIAKLAMGSTPEELKE